MVQAWGETTLVPCLGDGKDSAVVTAEALRDTSHSNLELASTNCFPENHWWLYTWQTIAYASALEKSTQNPLCRDITIQTP